MATFPNFYELEQKYGSIVRGGLQKSMPKTKNTGKKRSMFYSLEGGLQTLVEALEQALGDEMIYKNTKVKSLEKINSNYQLSLSDGSIVNADAVMVATPFASMKQMLGSYDFIQKLGEMKATSVANVVLAFDQSAIKEDIDGTGFVVSRNSSNRITACTWTHKKWPETTVPEGKALLRCYVGRPGDEEVIHLSDDGLEELVLADLNKIMRIDGKPLFSVVTRWENAMPPQYRVGHKQMVEKLEGDLMEHLPGVYVAGSPYKGIGIPDCIDQGGEETVKKMLEFLAE